MNMATTSSTPAVSLHNSPASPLSIATPTVRSAVTSAATLAANHMHSNGNVNGNNVNNGNIAMNGNAVGVVGSNSNSNVSVNGSINNSSNGAVSVATLTAATASAISLIPDVYAHESCLQRFVREEGLEEVDIPLHELRGQSHDSTVVLGIDGRHLLRRIVTAVRRNDPMAPLTATMPFTLYEELGAVHMEIRATQEVLGGQRAGLAENEEMRARGMGRGLRPVIVFDGIPLSAGLDANAFANPLSADEMTAYHAQSTESTVEHVAPTIQDCVATRFHCGEDVQGAIMRQLKMFYADVFCAPYLAAAQLAAMLIPDNRYVSELYGDILLLTFPGVQRVVTQLNPEKGTFNMLRKSVVLDRIRRRLPWKRTFTEADLAEWALIGTLKSYLTPYLRTLPRSVNSGNNYNINSPASLNNNNNNNNNMNNNSSSSTSNGCSSNASNANSNGNGSVHPTCSSSSDGINNNNNNSHAANTPPQSIAVQNLTQVEHLPESGLRAALMSSLPKEVMRYIDATLALMDAPVFISDGQCVPLYVVCQTRRMSTMSVLEAFGNRLPSVLYYSFFAGFISSSLITDAAQRCLVSHYPVVDSTAYREIQRVMLPLRVQICCQLLEFSPHLPRPMLWYQPYAPVRQMEERLQRIICPIVPSLLPWDVAHDVEINSRSTVYFYDVLPYVNSVAEVLPKDDVLYETVQETCASALLNTLDLLGYLMHCNDTDPTQIELSLFGEVLMSYSCDTLSEYAMLTLELLRTHALNDDPIRLNTPASKASSAYPLPPGMRFACRLLSIIPLNVDNSWSGPFDAEMAAFSSISRVVSKTLRSFVEALATLMFTTHRTRVPLESFADVTTSLPFSLPVEFGAGNVMMYLLQNPTSTIADLERVFPQCYALQSDLTTLFGFWCMSYTAMHKLADAIDLDRTLIEQANALVRNAALNLDPETYSFLR